MQYEIMDKFIYRKAVLPANNIEVLNQNLSNSDFVDYLMKNHYNILYSLSPNLVESLKYEKKNEEKIALSFYKYFSRCFSRATPYALSSTVGIGEFRRESNFYVDATLNEVIIDADGGWMFSLCEILEQELFVDLKVRKNNTLLLLESNLINIWVTKENIKNANKNNLIMDKTKALSLVLEISGEWITISMILNRLEKEYPKVEKKVFVKFLKDLIEAEVIVSDIRSGLLNPRVLQHTVKVLGNYPQCNKIVFLDEILKEMQKVENDRCFSENLKLITDHMNMICKSEKYLNVISKTPININFNKNIKKDIKDFARFLTKISEQIPKPMKHYKNHFIEKYGVNVGVPILTAISDGEELEDKDELVIRDNIIYKGLIRKIAHNKIDTSVDISFLNNKYDYKPQKLHNGFELSFVPIKKNGNLVFLISPLVGSNGIAKTFGRFDALFNEEITKLTKNVVNNGNYETVDIKFFPKEKTLLNIMNAPKLSNKVLSYGAPTTEESEEINLEDIYLYLDIDSNFHFINPNKKEVLFNVNNMLNLNYAPKILKNIMTISSKNDIQIFDLLHVLNAICMDIGFLPEITYKNLIISNRKMFIRKDEENEHLMNDFIQFKEYLRSIVFDSFNDTKCFLESGDNRIIIDMRNDLGIKVLYKELKKNEFILISEVPFEPEELLINDGYDSYVGEVVFQLYNPDYWNSKPNNDRSILQKKSNIKDNQFPPYEKYVYYKLYCKDSIQELVLKNNIVNWVKQLKERCLISGYFFVRYKDDKDHLRIRLVLHKEIDLAELVRINSVFTKNTLKEDMVSDIQISTYEREIYRYGSPEILDELEKLFCLESAILSSELYYLSKTEKNLLYYSVIMYYLELSSIDIKRQVGLLKNYKLRKAFRKEFEVFLSDYNNMFNSNNIYIGKLFNSFKESQNKIAKIFQSINNSGLNTEQIDSIYLSVFHMLHNRLIGIDRENENKVLSYISRSVRIKYEKMK